VTKLKKNQHLNLNNPFVVLSDFQSNLSMFNLPEHFKKKFKKDFPNINLKFINDSNINKFTDDIKVYWGTRFKSDYFKNYKNLSWIHFGSVGVEKIDFKLIKNKKNLFITNSKGINSSSMIELILFYLIDTSRSLLKKRNSFKNRNEYENNFILSKDLRSIKVLILGYGEVTKKLIPSLKALGINFDILSNQKSKLRNINFYEYKKLSKIINGYDVVINNLPINRLTKNIFDIDVLNSLKKDVSIISCGRYGIFNLDALFKFLSKNPESFLYIDAPTNKQQKNTMKLINISRLKNVYLSPHIGGYFKGYWPKQYQMFAVNLQKFIKGSKLENEISFIKEHFL
tara:strand:- start:986 stop:2011 length:1026 start_codon:yes stop_codon:yes gene_type:complete